MNGASNITEKILEDARRWSEEHLRQAESEAATVSQSYKAQAGEQREKLLAEGAERAAAVEERAQSQGEMERKKSVLAAKQAAVQAAFDAALQNLAGKSQEERTLLMTMLVLRYQSADAQLIVNQADMELVGPAVVETVNSVYTKQQLKQTFSGSFLEQVKKLTLDRPVKYALTLAPVPGKFAGGFILRQGNVEQNCTFEVLVNGVREELEGEVSSLLFQ